MTTTASTLKLKAEISRIQQLLQANGVAFEEARTRLRCCSFCEERTFRLRCAAPRCRAL